jgi:hypothetical protein
MLGCKSSHDQKSLSICRSQFFVCTGVRASSLYRSIWVIWGGTATLKDCLFTDNEIAINVRAVNPAVPSAVPQDSIARLVNCTFEDTLASNRLETVQGTVDDSEHAAVIYSDDVTLEAVRIDGDLLFVNPVEPLSAAPAGREGINGTSVWLQNAQQVCSFSAISFNTSYTVTAIKRCIFCNDTILLKKFLDLRL